MVTAFVSLPLTVRLLIVFLLSVIASRFANWAIYSWAHFSRQLGPWSNPPQGHSRAWADHVPVFGWWLLRRESKTHGTSYWLRPMLIEVIFPLAVTWYFHFLMSGGTLPVSLAMFVPLLQAELHGQFIGHFVLITLMTIATFIDFDEQSIPDSITIPGTVIGLLGAAFVPGWLGFTSFLSPVGGVVPIEMDACKPNTWLAWLNADWGLYFAIAIVIVWGFALLDRRVITRRGLRKMVVYFVARLLRPHWLWKVVVVVSAAMLVGVVMAWNQPITRWPYLLSSLFGLACAGGITWAVRISASAALRAQALGFGDVTLMAMIGTYVGWQPSILIFFIAPLMAVLIVVIQYLLTGEKAAPYGPYLCAATIALIALWSRLWFGWAMPVFALGLQILGILAACVVMMGAMLWIWRLIRSAIWSEDQS